MPTPSNIPIFNSPKTLSLIPRATVDKIMDAAHVEEVVGEFVTLKKRGANLLGLCPFHGEKTPSFTVTPVKGFYKCFGCGKAGNAVNFIMDHLQLSYPEALKWLARKYAIEVVEKEVTPEERAAQTEKESLLIVMQYAQRYFTDIMNNTDEGRSVGKGYFLERGLPEDIIIKFQLGYSLQDRNAFGKAAVKNQYDPKYLVKTGMSILSNRYEEGKEITVNDIFDRYAGRVMFPIHDDGGRVVAFGGRTLSTDKKVAKYINSPETDIYHKSRVLYGLWLGKKAIQEKDSCYLVEGYMDVIAMHQNGIFNVVASSGTSLTTEQVKSIHRFTRNIIVLYDGDAAGQKASDRAIPMLLEEGMNVRLLAFPDNDDPDSFSRKVSQQEFHDYLANNTTDFIHYKARKAFEDTKADPIRRASVIRDIVENIALIPDNIVRSVYVKECAGIMEIDEQVLQFEVTKIRRKAGDKFKKDEPAAPPEVPELPPEEEEKEPEFRFDAEERELLRMMVLHGDVVIEMEAEDEDQVQHTVELTLADYILFELTRDEIGFENPIHKAVYDEYVHEITNERIPGLQHFMRSQNPLVNTFVINQVISPHNLSPGWAKFSVEVPEERNNLRKAAEHLLFSLKEKKLHSYISEKQEMLKSSDYETAEELLKEIRKLDSLKSRVNKLLGRVIVK